MRVTVATTNDVRAVVEMASRFIRETSYAKILAVHTDHLERVARWLIQNGVILLAMPDHADDCASWCIYPDPHCCTEHDHRCNCGRVPVGMLALTALPHP